MRKVKIAFRELAASVTADVSVSYEGEDLPSNEDILKENVDLMNLALKESTVMSIKKKR